MFVITVILTLFVRYKHEILRIHYAKPNQELGFVRCNREFAITVIVITEFDCNFENKFNQPDKVSTEVKWFRIN